MMRIVVFLALVGVLAFGVAWLADRPGDVTIQWLGWRIETSVMVAVFAVAALAILAIALWSALRGIIGAPASIADFLQRRRGSRGYLAMSRGLIAVGVGDARAARKFNEEAKRLAPAEPLALLLAAQTAQLSGDRQEAQRAFAEMAKRPDTKLLGLRGLFVEAQRREDMATARAYAEEAAKTAPTPAWAGQAVLTFRCAAGDWAGALAALERNMRSRLLGREAYRRQRAVLLTARAQQAEENDRDGALAFVLEAVKLAPTFAPAAALAGRMLAEKGEMRKAGRIVERAWKANPHPELAAAYANLRFGDSARDRLQRAELLAKKTPGHLEGALAVARAALEAREFDKARAALAPFLGKPTQRLALLMAEVEQADGDEGRAREWTARAVHAAQDPAWTADGIVSQRWLPVSPVSGRLDAFEWRVPLAELPGREAPRFDVEMPAPSVAAAPAALPLVDIPTARPATGAEPSEKSSETSGKPPRRAAPRPRRSKPPAVEPIVPLAHVPDDPGPEAETEADPVPEASPEGWNKLRQMFKAP
ncbi:MAG TPA: heme biosynthesis HemY N-terminal domain-containing protein [Xanthobacteraceae bacterium]|nr:heme biosynthesis HemY N-terminal domain-containing protein [Xanthobacteraceae bacterium]